jgi:hypothetical protein
VIFAAASHAISSDRPVRLVAGGVHLVGRLVRVSIDADGAVRLLFVDGTDLTIPKEAP